MLEHPERLEQEYRRRLLQAQTPPDLEPLERQVGRVRQGVTRLIDSYSEGLIDKEEFEPRITRMRERLLHLEAQAQEAHNFIRKLLADIFEKNIAADMRILYGGSVKPENIDILMQQEDIDGALVGGAALTAESFGRIICFQQVA